MLNKGKQLSTAADCRILRIQMKIGMNPKFFKKVLTEKIIHDGMQKIKCKNRT